MGGETIRCFIALDLPREVMKEIERLQEQIKKQKLFVGKFVEVENLHLTLKFLGEIDEDTVDRVKERLKKVEFKEFESSLGDVGVFSSKYSSYIRVIWVKLKGADRLQKQIDGVLDGLFEKENRFMSHITLARVKKVSDRKGLIEYVKHLKSRPFKFKVDKFFLKKSELKPEGPVYEDLESYELSSPPNSK